MTTRVKKKKQSLPDDREFTEKEITAWLKRARPYASVKKFRKGAVVTIQSHPTCTGFHVFEFGDRLCMCGKIVLDSYHYAG